MVIQVRTHIPTIFFYLVWGEVMPSGFQAFNDYNTLQVDQNYFNLALIEKQTINTSVAAVEGYKATFFTGAALPVFALYSASGAVTITRTSASGGGWSVDVFCRGAPAAVEVFIFGKTPASSAGNAGIQVFKETGEKAFDSNYKYMRIVHVQAFTGQASYENPPEIILPPNRKYATVWGDTIGIFDQVSFPNNEAQSDWTTIRDIFQMSARSLGDRVTFMTSQTFSTSSRGPAQGDRMWSKYTGHVPILDVTNY